MKTTAETILNTGLLGVHLDGDDCVFCWGVGNPYGILPKRIVQDELALLSKQDEEGGAT